MSQAFKQRKTNILTQLSTPDDTYTDASPKGAIDAPIRAFVDEINTFPDLVTLSSCSGRIALYLEGPRKDIDSNSDGDQTNTSTGGKGGGQWLFVTHTPLTSIPSLPEMITSPSETPASDLRVRYDLSSPLPRGARLLHLKFEPMILHILVSSLVGAKKLLSAAQGAGFRESGIGGVNLGQGGEAETVMVAVRSTGLATDSPVAYLGKDGEVVGFVAEEVVRGLVEWGNAKFGTNAERTEAFRVALLGAFKEGEGKDDWEPADVRKARKREEGLRRAAEKREQEKVNGSHVDDDVGLLGSE